MTNSMLVLVQIIKHAKLICLNRLCLNLRNEVHLSMNLNGIVMVYYNTMI